MSISRREFAGAIWAAGLSLMSPKMLNGQQPEGTIRVIAYNAFGCLGWPKDRALAQKSVANEQMAKRFAMELAKYDPDIINLSESPSEQVVEQVADLMKMNFVRFPSKGDWPGTILSRFEILDSKNVPLDGERPKELFTRHWGQATVALPGGEKLIVHSAHLFPTEDVTVRLREIALILDAMKGDLTAGRSLLLMGDLNLGPDSKEYQHLINAGFVDTFANAGKGNGLTYRSDIPRHRIDYVMATGPITKQIIESRSLFEGAFRLNLADKESFALSDHLPVLAVFKSVR